LLFFSNLLPLGPLWSCGGLDHGNKNNATSKRGVVTLRW
jgi:hypothetical protein